MNLAYGLSQGLAAGAGAVSALASNEIKKQSDIEAEKRAMDQKLDLYTRQKAIDEVMAQRAAEYKQQQAAKVGGQINDVAGGILNTQNAADMSAASGAPVDPNNPDTAATLKLLQTPEGAAANAAYEKAGYIKPNDEEAQVKRKAEAAGILGALPEQKELNDRSKDISTAKHQARQDDTRNTLAEKQLQAQVDHTNAILRSSEAAANRADKRAQKDDDRAQLAALANVDTSLKSQAKELDAELNNMMSPPTPERAKQIAAELKGIQSQAKDNNDRRMNFIENGTFDVPKKSGAPAPKPAPAVGTEINGLVFAGGDPNDKNAWKPKPTAAPMAYTPPTSSGSHDEPAAAPMKSNGKSDIVKRLADIEDMLKDPAMGGKERLTLEKLDLLRQLNQGGILNSVQSLGR